MKKQEDKATECPLQNQQSESKAKHHALMALLIIIWGVEFAVSSDALNIYDSISLVFAKYVVGLVTMGTVMVVTKQSWRLRRKDIPVLIVCALAGPVLYFQCEYAAIGLMPVANITIMLAFLPVVTVLLERVMFGRRITAKLMIGIFACIIGIVITVGSDLLGNGVGKPLGYLFCLGALCCWAVYLFATEKVGQDYSTVTIAFYQTLIAVIVTAPLGIPHLPPLSDCLQPKLLMEILYIGVITEGCGFLIEVNGVKHLGTTITGIYSNLLPVTTALAGLLFLQQGLVPLQILGGVVVITAGVIVIREKGKINDEKESKSAN